MVIQCELIYLFHASASNVKILPLLNANTSSSLHRMPVYVPTGFACFPNELMHTPKLWVKQKYRKLVTYTAMARGGHFAAMEEPQLMAEDIQNFTKTVEKKKK